MGACTISKQTEQAEYGSQDLDFARIREIFQKHDVRNVAQNRLQLDLRFPAVLETELDFPVLPRDSKNEVVLDRNRDVQRFMVLNQSGKPRKRSSRNCLRAAKGKPGACRSGFGGRKG